MRKIGWTGLIVLLCVPLGTARAELLPKNKHGPNNEIKARLHGRIIDHTNNHGTDNRIWSPSLFQRRDLYVYLPPGFEPCQSYPLMIWLHGVHEDEQEFRRHIAPLIDDAIQCGKLPPLIVAAPDGSFHGKPCHLKAGSFFLNTDAGLYGDFVLYDVFDFVAAHYPVRPEREAHVIAGTSMGGFAAYHYGIKHREAFGVALGICPPLNLRWQDKKGRPHAAFDPREWAWRCELNHGKLRTVSHGGKSCCIERWFAPLYGEAALDAATCDNPIEMIDRYWLRPGEVEMYVGYSGEDEYNIGAQVDSFLYYSKWRGLTVCVGYVESGHHNIHTFKRLLPDALVWLGPRIADYSPATFGPACAAPKHRFLKGIRHQDRACPDLSQHLPPLWLPDQVPEE